MAKVSVDVSGVGADWTKPCQQAVSDLNALFVQLGINVALVAGGTKRPTITVVNDPAIKGDLVHGRTSAEVNGAGKLTRAAVRLPVSVAINTPQGVRGAGPGVLEVIAAHELVHALGHSAHNSHLMGQTFEKKMGNTAAGDRLTSGGVAMPPLKLSSQSIKELKAIWP